MLVYKAGADAASIRCPGVDVLCRGKQFVGWGIHPTTGQPYAWEGATPADTQWADLPEANGTQIAAFIAEIGLEPANDRSPAPQKIRAGPQSLADRSTAATVESALAALDPSAFDYSGWIEIGMAIHADQGDAGLALWDAWSSRDSGKGGDGNPRYQPGKCAKHWSSFRDGGGIGIATLFKRAKGAGWTPHPSVGSRQPGASPLGQPNSAQQLLDRIAAGNFRTGQDNTPKPSNDGLEYFDTLQPNLAAPWRVRGLLPERALSLVYGHPGSGKSFLALDIAFAIARGVDWFGRRTRQGGVVYVAAEGQEGVRRRVAAYRKHHDAGPPVAFALAPFAINLFNEDADVHRLLNWIMSAAQDLGRTIDLVVIDTVSRTLGDGDENTRDMTAYVNNVTRIMNETGAGVMLVHHRPKNNENVTPRGHGSLLGAVDTCLLVEGAAAGVRHATVQKQKDADPGEPVDFLLIPVTIGVDDEGLAVTSCIIAPPVPRLGAFAEVRTAQKPKLSPDAKAALRELERLMEGEGVSQPDDFPTDRLPAGVTKVVCVKTWQDNTIAGEATPDRKPESAKKAFRRARDALGNAGLVGYFGECAWLAPSPLAKRTDTDKGTDGHGHSDAQSNEDGGPDGTTP